jgi:hypothetical protein
MNEEKQAINIYVSIKEYVSKTDAQKVYIPPEMTRIHPLFIYHITVAQSVNEKPYSPQAIQKAAIPEVSHSKAPIDDPQTQHSPSAHASSFSGQKAPQSVTQQQPQPQPQPRSQPSPL